MLKMTTLSWFVLIIFFAGAFGDEHHIGKLPRRSDYKQAHASLKVIDGNKVAINKYPFIASLQNSLGQFGAAVIVSNDYLITTAFNVAWSELHDFQFRVGSASYADKGQVLNAAQVIIHPNYTGSWDYNIAVVKTDKPIKFNKKVKAATMATTKLKAKTVAQVIGWGEESYDSAVPSEVLLEGDVTVMEWQNCNKTYGSDLTDRLMCTFNEITGPCEYDYGDPLVSNKILYGLFAGGYDCKPGVNPVLYADISQLSTWVKSIISA